MRIIGAAALYFLIVFRTGFLLGPIRIFRLEPSLGETIAILCEAPFILIAIVLAARWVPRWLSLTTDAWRLAAMGIGALVLQQVADFAVGGFLRGITPIEQLMHLATPAGLIYAALLIAFAAMPLLGNRHRPPFSPAQQQARNYQS